MRTFLVAASLAVMALAGPALAAEARQDFTLVNRTGYELKELYVSPNKASDWQEDVLGRDTLEDGQSVRVHFKAQTKTCKWDLKVVYTDDDSSAIWSDINLCEVEKITIRYDRDRDVTRATFD